MSGTLFSGSVRTEQPNQPSVMMQPGKHLKPVSFAQPFSVTYRTSSLEIESSMGDEMAVSEEPLYY